MMFKNNVSFVIFKYFVCWISGIGISTCGNKVFICIDTENENLNDNISRFSCECALRA